MQKWCSICGKHCSVGQRAAHRAGWHRALLGVMAMSLTLSASLRTPAGNPCAAVWLKVSIKQHAVHFQPDDATWFAPGGHACARLGAA